MRKSEEDANPLPNPTATENPVLGSGYSQAMYSSSKEMGTQADADQRVGAAALPYDSRVAYGRRPTSSV